MNTLLLWLAGLQLVLLLGLLFFVVRRQDHGQRLEEVLRRLEEGLRRELKDARDDQGKTHVELLRSLQAGSVALGEQVQRVLGQYFELLNKRVEGLTQTTDQKLKEIGGQVEKRLAEGFEKTTATFADIVKRLALIDEAQKRITELSTNVVSLQEILSDKRARGAFGEVQLSQLVRNMLPENAFALQYAITPDTRVDCILFLPDPTGHVPIDAKFPLESYRRLADPKLGEADRRMAERQFKQDVRKHVRDIASKYIVAGKTARGAVMFVPAEAVFAEIHARHADVVEEAQGLNVWITSPTTLMAILTTARAVLKDDATRKQVHVIQEHLGKLGEDFGRFRKRMENLATHIRQAKEDVDDVNVSAGKIASRFEKIERAELANEEEERPALKPSDAA
ncbi:MAG: DNA recombination protein RmuC [Nevskiales bacterium]